jgi:hypothetical protein
MSNVDANPHNAGSPHLEERVCALEAKLSQLRNTEQPRKKLKPHIGQRVRVCAALRRRGLSWSAVEVAYRAWIIAQGDNALPDPKANKHTIRHSCVAYYPELQSVKAGQCKVRRTPK